MPDPDLRILALADAKVMPPEIQSAFDRWRIWKARDAIVVTVRKRISSVEKNKLTVSTYLERLEAADTEDTIIEGIYALAEVLEVHRKTFGLHKDYIILMMSGQVNPWGLLALHGDFGAPPPTVIQASQELWRLAREKQYDVERALKLIKDQTLAALEAYYAAQPKADSVPNDQKPASTLDNMNQIGTTQ
jgi:hypothetical protein